VKWVLRLSLNGRLVMMPVLKSFDKESSKVPEFVDQNGRPAIVQRFYDVLSFLEFHFWKLT
jgi:hypothetical protein